MFAKIYVDSRSVPYRATAALVAMGLLAGCASTSSTRPDSNQQVIDLSVQFEGMSVEEIVKAGDVAFTMGDYDRAEFIFNQAVVVDDVPANWLKLGETLVRLGKTPYAGRAFQNAIQLDPENAVARERLGILYIGNGQVSIAREYLHRAIQIDDSRWAAHNALGVLADTERNYPMAIGHYNAALNHNPESAKVLTNLGYSHYLSGELNLAENLYLDALRLDPSHERAISNLGLIYARRGEYDDAVEILRRVTPRPQALNDVGYVAYSNGDLDAATLMLSEAIRISPSYYETAYENLERVERARRRQNDGAADAGDAKQAELTEVTE